MKRAHAYHERWRSPGAAPAAQAKPTALEREHEDPWHPRIRAIGHIVRDLIRVNAALVVVGALMVATLVATLVGLIVDPRVITGAPAWIKPASAPFSPDLRMASAGMMVAKIAAKRIATSRIGAQLYWLSRRTLFGVVSQEARSRATRATSRARFWMP